MKKPTLAWFAVTLSFVAGLFACEFVSDIKPRTEQDTRGAVQQVKPAPARAEVGVALSMTDRASDLPSQE